MVIATLREICVTELSFVVHCRANRATDASKTFLLLHQITIQRFNFEPGGWESESLRHVEYKKGSEPFIRKVEKGSDPFLYLKLRRELEFIVLVNSPRNHKFHAGIFRSRIWLRSSPAATIRLPGVARHADPWPRQSISADFIDEATASFPLTDTG